MTEAEWLACTHRIVVRLFAELPDDGAAEVFRATARDILTPFGDILETEAKRYWKVPEWFEVSIELKPVAEPHSAFTDILSFLGQGWQQFNTTADESSAVWNPGLNASFFSPIVRWANVELFPESTIGSP